MALNESPLGFQLATQKGLADAVGASKDAISRIERGLLPLSEGLAAKVEAATGISAAWLLAGNPDHPMAADGKPYDAERRLRVPIYKQVAMSEERARLLGNRVTDAMIQAVNDQPHFSLLFHRVNEALKVNQMKAR